jgi:outer membrane protein assembly factor BamD (BamD/ComL family)
MRAINEGRWLDAEAIFTKLATQQGEHSDGALYWKAYAQNKQGQVKAALETCAELAATFLPATGSMSAGRWRSRFTPRLGTG